MLCNDGQIKILFQEDKFGLFCISVPLLFHAFPHAPPKNLNHCPYCGKSLSVSGLYQSVSCLKICRVTTVSTSRSSLNLRSPIFRFGVVKKINSSQWDLPSFIVIIIIIFINCNWVVTRRQWLFYMYTKYEIGY